MRSRLCTRHRPAKHETRDKQPFNMGTIFDRTVATRSKMGRRIIPTARLQYRGLLRGVAMVATIVAAVVAADSTLESRGLTKSALESDPRHRRDLGDLTYRYFQNLDRSSRYVSLNVNILTSDPGDVKVDVLPAAASQNSNSGVPFEPFGIITRGVGNRDDDNSDEDEDGECEEEGGDGKNEKKGSDGKSMKNGGEDSDEVRQ
jgi:hypothetical protein